MKVTITESCNRCKRQVPREVDSSEIAAMEQAAETRAAKSDEIIEHLKGLENAPDLVVMFKGAVQVIDRICDAHCAGTVKNSLTTVFKVIDPSKRKPRTVKTPEEKAAAKAAKDAKDAKDTKDAKSANRENGAKTDSQKSGKGGVKGKTSQQAATK